MHACVEAAECCACCACWGMLMFPLRRLWGIRWLDLQPPGWSPSLQQLSLWFDLTSTGRSSRSRGGHGSTPCVHVFVHVYVCVCVWSYLGSGGGRWPLEEGSLVLRGALWRIRRGLKCFLCGWQDPTAVRLMLWSELVICFAANIKLHGK